VLTHRPQAPLQGRSQALWHCKIAAHLHGTTHTQTASPTRTHLQTPRAIWYPKR